MASARSDGVTLVHADRNTPGFMRSQPVVPYIYALESEMDETRLSSHGPCDTARASTILPVDAMGTTVVLGRFAHTDYYLGRGAFRLTPQLHPARMRDGDWLIVGVRHRRSLSTHVGSAARGSADGKWHGEVQIARKRFLNRLPTR